MYQKGKKFVIISFVLVIAFILSAGNPTAGNTVQDSNPSPQLRPKDNEVLGFPPGWIDDTRLTYAINASKNGDIATFGDNVYIVWKDDRSGNLEVYFKKSEDGGLSWSEDVKISSVSPSPFCEPRIAINGSQIHVVWEGLDITREVHYRNSTDEGETWNAEVRLTENDGSQSYLPDIYVVGNIVHVVWNDKRDYPEPELYYRNSTNGGGTWNPPQRLTNYPDADGSVHIQANGSKVHITWARWLTKNEVFYMSSNDGGITWSPEQQLTPNDGVETFPYSIAVWHDNVHILYRDAIEGSPEVYYMNSTDGGGSWSNSKRISDLGDHSYSPDIIVNGDDVYVVWMDDRDYYGYVGDPWGPCEVYFSNSTDGGITWSSNLRLTYAKNQSTYPEIALSNNGNIHIVWQDNRTGNNQDYEIYYKRYPDFPDLSPPDHSNETPPSDSYKDAPGTNISVHVTDPSGVNESTIQLWVNGSLVVYSLTPITDGYNVSYVSPGFEPGVVECQIVVDDNCSNTLDYTWNFTVLATYNSQLGEGWNLISIPFVQVNTSIKEVLRDIDGKWDFIEYYDAVSGEWKSYATFWPESLNDFNEINNTMAIWINITELNVNLTVRGLISTYTEIPLKAGWNFVGYPTQTIETVANALWGTGAVRVEVFDVSDPYRLKEVGATYVMKPGEGYWVHVPIDTVWIVDW